MLQFRMGMKKHTGDNFLYRIAGTSPLCGQYPGRVNAATAGFGWIYKEAARFLIIKIVCLGLRKLKS